MKYLLICAIVFLTVNTALSKEKIEDWAIPRYCVLIGSEKDSSLEIDKVRYEFEFYNIAGRKNKLQYSIDGVNHESILTKGNRLVVQATAGKHIFEFLIDGYYELFTDSLMINSQNCDTYRLSFRKVQTIKVKDDQFVTYKPVIYLYPEEELKVKVSIDIHGSDKFLYPNYKNGWEFTAKTNGDLIFEDATYNYLFWEAKSSNSVDLNAAESGFFVEKKDVVSFLEEKLTLANFTSEEQADFITFWGPKLCQNDLSFVHFIFNETCNQYAELNIQPKPKNIFRMYILWSNVDERFEIDEQQIESADRSGFTVIEWGGQEQIITSNTAGISH